MQSDREATWLTSTNQSARAAVARAHSIARHLGIATYFTAAQQQLPAREDFIVDTASSSRQHHTPADARFLMGTDDVQVRHEDDKEAVDNEVVEREGEGEEGEGEEEEEDPEEEFDDCEYEDNKNSTKEDPTQLGRKLRHTTRIKNTVINTSNPRNFTSTIAVLKRLMQSKLGITIVRAVVERAILRYLQIAHPALVIGYFLVSRAVDPDGAVLTSALHRMGFAAPPADDEKDDKEEEKQEEIKEKEKRKMPTKSKKAVTTKKTTHRTIARSTLFKKRTLRHALKRFVIPLVVVTTGGKRVWINVPLEAILDYITDELF